MDFDKEIEQLRQWFQSPRFKGIKRVHTAREVVEQRGTIRPDYAVARGAAEAFYTRLRQLFEQKKSITTFGPYSPGQAVAMKRMGIEGIYLGGWATSAKGSAHEDPGPDLASYPLSQVPNEAAPIVRALLTADKNQFFARARMTEEQRRATPEVDYRPFIIADADTGHGGDAHVRNLIRRFVEVGVPGYHIEDQKPGVKKCGHQGGKVLVSEDEQVKRLSAARFQLDIMGVARDHRGPHRRRVGHAPRRAQRRPRPALHPGRRQRLAAQLQGGLPRHPAPVPAGRRGGALRARVLRARRRRVRRGRRLAREGRLPQGHRRGRRPVPEGRP